MIDKSFIEICALRDQLLESGTLPEGIFTDYQKYAPELRSTDFYRAVKSLPKGRVHHLHIEATYNVDWMLEKLLERRDVFVYLGGGDLELGRRYEWEKYQLVFEPYFRSEFCPLDGKIPNAWIRLNESGLSAQDLKPYLSFQRYGDIESLPTWTKFEKLFSRLSKVFRYEPFARELYLDSFTRLIEDGISEADLKVAYNCMYREDGSLTNMEEVITLLEDIARKAESDSGRRLRIRIIECGYKGAPDFINIPLMEEAATLHRHRPDLLIGYDLVGEEDTAPTMNPGAFLSRAASEGLPLYLHAGETRRDGNGNIAAALKLLSVRIGHGLDLHSHPELMQTIIDRGTTLEVCPLSNLILGYVDDLREHPAKEYLRNDIPLSISGDDPAFFGTRAVSDDLAAAILAWKLSPEECEKLLIFAEN